MKRKTKRSKIKRKARKMRILSWPKYYKPVFWWITHDDRQFKPSAMATGHLFNAIKMIYNNTVPPAFRVGKFRRWTLGFSPEYIQEAMRELTAEFESRDDNFEYLETYKEMGSNARFMLGQGRNPLNHLCVLLSA